MMKGRLATGILLATAAVSAAVGAVAEAVSEVSPVTRLRKRGINVRSQRAANQARVAAAEAKRQRKAAKRLKGG